MPLNIIRDDITKLNVDAIVNAANTNLTMGGGVCGAIFRVAGADILQEACDRLAPIETGEAVITPGFNLTAKFIIHAAGPVYQSWNKEQSKQLLRAAYLNALKRALENQCESIAFPLISSGIYGYPKEEALNIAVSTIREFLLKHEIDVTLVVFDKSAFTISHQLLGAVESYIDEHYVSTHQILRRSRFEETELLYEEMHEAISVQGAFPSKDMFEKLEETFSEKLLRLIDEQGKTDVEVYKRANINRKLFSKIRTGKGYTPSKKTVLAFALALELSLDETDDLLECAGYALSHAVKFDVIVEYFIASARYDIFEVNEVLFKYDQPLLGG